MKVPEEWKPKFHDSTAGLCRARGSVLLADVESSGGPASTFGASLHMSPYSDGEYCLYLCHGPGQNFCMASIAPPKRLDKRTAALALLRVLFENGGDHFYVAGSGLLDTDDFRSGGQEIREEATG